MIQSVREDFQDRMLEVSSFLELWATAEEQWSSSRTPLQVGRAAVYLMLYNVVEATVRTTTETMLRAVESEGHPVCNLAPSLQTFYYNSVAAKATTLGKSKLAEAILKEVMLGTSQSPARMEPPKFSGNLDARKISEYLGRLGIGNFYQKRTHNLLAVKTRRNNLAHGLQRFSEVGREVTLSDLQDAVDEVGDYLEAMLQASEVWISDREYLSSS